MTIARLPSDRNLESWFSQFSLRSHCVWLDGAVGTHGSEWSILSCDPVEQRSGPQDDLLGWLDEWESRLGGEVEGIVPFTGGLIGQLDYPEDMPAYPAVAKPMLSGWLGLYDRALVEDRKSGCIYAVVGDWLKDSEAELKRWMEKLLSWEIPNGSIGGEDNTTRSSRPLSDMSRREYVDAVERLRDWIAAGDIYQANLSQRFHCEWPESAESLYRSLRRENPAPYSAYLDIGDRQILSSSPELFLSVDASRQVLTQPIKGTRPRSVDPEKDRDLARDLRNNAKERAELLMIVDMERSDLGRVCKPGSVVADLAFRLESFASVHHLVGDVKGELRPEISLSDLLVACFPGGSITGAPKVRAMEIIREVEPSIRRAFCGSVGYLSAAGVSCWNIAIRTMEMSGLDIEFGVGAGIVWDSDPEAEYRETLQKARKIFASLGWYEENEGQ